MTTAAPSVPVSAQSIASPLTRIFGRPQSSNYLQRLVQDLDPKVVAHHKFCERAFKVAQIVSLFMVPALFGSAAGIVLSPLAPILAIPVVIGLSIAGGLTTMGVSNFFKTCKEEHENKARHLAALAERLRSLPQNPRDLATKLASMHIEWNRIPGVRQLDDLTQLKPLMALYDERIDRQRFWQAVAADWESVVYRIACWGIDPFTAAENSALTEKIKAAFVHAVIQNPEFAGKFKDLALIDSSSSADRSFLLFNNRNIQPITRAELSDESTMPVHRLAERFLQAMRA